MVGMPTTFRHAALCALGFFAACTSTDVTPTSAVPGGQQPPAGSSSLAIGGTANVAANGSLTLVTGSSGAEYALVVTDTALTAKAAADAFRVSGTNISAPGTVSQPATSRIPLSESIGPTTLTLDFSFAVRLNQSARRELSPRVPGAQRAYAQRSTAPSASATAAAVQVGDLLTLNVGSDPCTTIVPRIGRVAAIGTTSIVVADTLNPAGGFTQADYQRFGTRFDTLVYPLDVANFGAPAAFGPEGKILLFFTTAVNALTPKSSQSYVGGFFFERDQFPVLGTPELQACKGSNARNIFYLLTPDPIGTINGNIRRTGFVDSITTNILAHEFQHLINSSRRLYVNGASTSSDVVWLNEGLSHIAEELLFYHEGRSGPRLNLDVDALRASTALKDAFNSDQSSNTARYREYLIAPSTSSPIRDDDSISTRGATWDLLRYLADRKVRLSGGTDASIWFALANSKTSGVANLRAVFGANLGGMLRDWSIAQYTDDATPSVSVDLTQPSWNWRSIFPALGSTASAFPLVVNPLGTEVSGTVIPGGAAFYRFAVAANTSASLTLTAASGVVQATVVRLR